MSAQAAALDQFEIAKAGLLDLPGLRAQQQACFGTDAYDTVTLLGLFFSPGMVRLKSVHNRGLTGFIAAEYMRSAGCGWIITVGVVPEFTGRGIATALMLAAEHALRSSEMRLTVRSGNRRAIALYERLGYRWCGTHRGYYRNGEDGLIMQKLIGLPGARAGATGAASPRPLN